MADGYVLHRATPEDSLTIANHRAAIFFEMGAISQKEIRPLVGVVDPWTSELIATNRYVGWLAQHENRVVAGGGAYLRETPPGPGCFRLGRWAHIANVYTSPEHRRRGLARLVMGEILSWCVENSMDRVTLTSSEDGRPLYEALGFAATNDMNWDPKKYEGMPGKLGALYD